MGAASRKVNRSQWPGCAENQMGDGQKRKGFKRRGNAAAGQEGNAVAGQTILSNYLQTVARSPSWLDARAEWPTGPEHGQPAGWGPQ